MIDLIRAVRPEILFVHASSDAFPDHRVVHELVMAAVAGAAGPWYQEASGEPHMPPTILGYEVWHPLSSHQLAVDITATVERKLDALRCHQSQIEPTHYDEAFLGLARYRGVMSFSGTYAEVFEVLRTLPEPACRACLNRIAADSCCRSFPARPPCSWWVPAPPACCWRRSCSAGACPPC